MQISLVALLLGNYTQYRGNELMEILLRLCVKYSSLVHFNLNQNIQQNIASQKRV